MKKLEKDSVIELNDLKIMRHNLKMNGYHDLTLRLHRWIVGKRRGDSIENIFPDNYEEIIRISNENDLFNDK
ncbi:MAG: hypothetical protein KO202_06325 [Methanobacteriaceae archaeon]|jgi:hypothetical protein|nr:hypothetical protein [Methanobacteriaceae archaeon]